MFTLTAESYKLSLGYFIWNPSIFVWKRIVLTSQTRSVDFKLDNCRMWNLYPVFGEVKGVVHDKVGGIWISSGIAQYYVYNIALSWFTVIVVEMKMHVATLRIQWWYVPKGVFQRVKMLWEICHIVLSPLSAQIVYPRLFNITVYLSSVGHDHVCLSASQVANTPCGCRIYHFAWIHKYC